MKEASPRVMARWCGLRVPRRGRRKVRNEMRALTRVTRKPSRGSGRATQRRRCRAPAAISQWRFRCVRVDHRLMIPTTNVFPDLHRAIIVRHLAFTCTRTQVMAAADACIIGVNRCPLGRPRLRPRIGWKDAIILLRPRSPGSHTFAGLGGPLRRRALGTYLSLFLALLAFSVRLIP